MTEYIHKLKSWFEQKIILHSRSTEKSFHYIRGEIWSVNFGINIGSEFNNTRPALIYQNRCFSQWDTVLVIPITKHESQKHIPEHDIILDAGTGWLILDSIVRIGSLRAISKRRIGLRIGKITNSAILDKIDMGILQFLGIKNPLREGSARKWASGENSVREGT